MLLANDYSSTISCNQMTTNRHQATVDGFGDEWERFDQSQLIAEEHLSLFNSYFSDFPWAELPANPIGFDMGCGSGRWATLVAPRVGVLHCIDPSSSLAVAKRNLKEHTNCVFHAAGVNDRTLPSESMDFGYSLGVLHHVPDTAAGIAACVEMLKPGAPLLLYLYYAFDNRPFWFRIVWRVSDILRRVISRLPHGARYWVTQLVAALVYWPLARLSALAERAGLSGDSVGAMPLGAYRHLSFYTMRTDALDRFGTQLEQRFTRHQIAEMMEAAGLQRVRFSDAPPYWRAVGYRRK
jgi:SAM-dependent methyltransferase